MSDDDHGVYSRGFEKNLDKLLKLSLKEAKIHDESGKLTMDKSDAEVIRTKYDKRIYLFDLFKSILTKVDRYDYRFPSKSLNKNNSDFELTDTSADTEKSSDMEQSEALTNADGDLDHATLRSMEVMLTKKCKRCETIKAPKSHHCSICKRCIARMDHHCPWVNNCVGYYNQKHFLLFLVYVFLGSSHAISIIAMKTAKCLD